MIVLTLVLGFFYRQAAISNAIQEKVRENNMLAQLFANDIWEEFSPYLADIQNQTTEALLLHPGVREFDSVIRARAGGLSLGVLQVTIYALNGKTIFSTEPNLLGKNGSSIAGFNEAKSGQVSTNLVFKKLVNTLNRTKFNRDVVISFLPIYKKGASKVDAVLEIHTDLTRALAEIDRDQSRAYVAIAATLFALFIILFVIVRRADKFMKQHALRFVIQQQQIEHQAYHDVLTGLPNRILFRDRLQHAIQVADRREMLLAVLIVNLDRFKQVNDTFGHSVGDGLLLQAVARLKYCIRQCDTLARSSGDEFYIMLESISILDEAEEIAAHIIDEFAAPVVVGDHEVFVTPSIGIVIYPFADDDAEVLIKKANTAVYQAKDAGRNTFRFYSPGMLRQAASRFSLENALRRALDRDEFELHYQPVIHLKTGKTTAVEALLRWHSPEFGLISPLDFVPILEDTGLIIPVGQWVLEAACAQTVNWHQQGIIDLKVNVNISAIQFLQQCIAKQVRRALNQSGLTPHFLDLEITESLLIDDISNSMRLLDTLNEMGVSLSIDDFGTGYSSLSYLKRMPIETLKIDRSFVRDITEDVNDAAIVDAICALSSSLRFKVTAEGVENRDQLNFLRGMGVDAVQGYLFSRPLPVREITEFLLKKRVPDSRDAVA